MISRLIHNIQVIIRPLILLAFLTVSVKAGAAIQTANSIDSLKIELSKATTAADSVSILHNLYDCYFFNDRRPILYQIYETAEHAKDYVAMLETLFVLTSIFQYEPELEPELVAMANRVPESELQRAQLLYIRLRYQATNLSQASEDERQQQLHKALKEYREQNSLNKYDRIACLFLICTNLRNSTDSELLIHYLDQLHDMVEEFPEEELAVRSLFYTLAINSYIDNEMYDKAIVANNRMLDIVGQFDKLHESQGRIFRNYDGTLFQAYHNMLVCAQELTDEEIDKYYDLSLRIAATNPRIHSDITMQNKTRIYYLMAKKRYAEAIPLLIQHLKTDENKSEQYQYATLLVKAAREVGNKDALLFGSRTLNSIYRERLMAKSDVSLSELQTIYDVEDLKDQNKDLIFENQRMEISRRQQGLIAIALALVILIIILVWMITLYVHSRRLARKLSEYNQKLVEERNSLEEVSAKLADTLDKAKVADRTKTAIVENMSDEIREPLSAIVEYSHIIADYAKNDDRPYIQEYADAMIINTDLLIRLVNDILDLPKIESGELSIHRSPSSVKAICNFALELVKKHVAPEVEIIYANADQPDTIILTDTQRVEQILLQILSNAAKFTEAGSITLSYKINQHGDKISFAVTDTGIGIPQGMSEKIFDRFVKIDPTAQGNGLGLYISRILAKMLGGKLSLDKKYRDGARFVLTIPIS